MKMPLWLCMLWKFLLFLPMTSLLSCGPASHGPSAASSNLQSISDSTYTLKLTRTDNQYHFETCFTGTSECVAAFQTASDQPITMSKKETDEFHKSQLYTLRGMVKSPGGKLIGSALTAGGSGALASASINYAEENLPNVKKLSDIQKTLLQELNDQGVATVGEAKEILTKRQKFLKQNKLTILSSKPTDPSLLGILLDPNIESLEQIEQARNALIEHNNRLRIHGIDVSTEVPTAKSLMAIKSADQHIFDNKFIQNFGRSAINELRSAHMKVLPALQSPEIFAQSLRQQGLDYDTILSRTNYHRAEEILKPMYRPSYQRYVKIQNTLASWQGWKELPVSTGPKGFSANLENILEYVQNKGMPPIFDKIVETNTLTSKLTRAFPSSKAAQTLTSPGSARLGTRLLRSPGGQVVMIIAASAAGFFGGRWAFDSLGNQNVILQYPSLMELQAESSTSVDSAEDVLERLAKLLASSGYKVHQYCLPDGCLSVN